MKLHCKDTLVFEYTRVQKVDLETGGIDPPTSHMLSERSTIWATSPSVHIGQSGLYPHSDLSPFDEIVEKNSR